MFNFPSATFLQRRHGLQGHIADALPVLAHVDVAMQGVLSTRHRETPRECPIYPKNVV